MRKTLILFTAALLSGLILTGCFGNSPKSDDLELWADLDTSSKIQNQKDLSGYLTIWTQNNIFTNVVASFKKRYPKVKVSVQEFPTEDIAQKVLDTLIEGSAVPDLFLSYPSSYYTYFDKKMRPEIVNLLASPYEAGRYRKDFNEALWDSWLNLDNTKLFGFPLEQNPNVLFYRSDLLADYGFPTAPEQLAVFLADRANFVQMAQAFKEDDKYIIGNNPSLLMILSLQNMFDSDLNYVVNSELDVELFDILKELTKKGLYLEQATAGDAKSGKLVMLYSVPDLASWLQANMPGGQQWRMTRLPFGMYSSRSGQGLYMLEQSTFKDEAWAFMQYAAATLEGQAALYGKYDFSWPASAINISSNVYTLPVYQPMWEQPEVSENKNAYLGGQQLYKIARQILEQTPVNYKTTPLDLMGMSKWGRSFRQVLDEAVNNNLDAQDAIDQLQQDVEDEVKQAKANYFDSISTPETGI